MNCNRADTIGVLANKNFLLIRIHVVYLIGVTGSINNHVIFKVMNVESLIRVDTKASKEFLVSSGNGRIRDLFLLMPLGVELIKSHVFFNWFLYHRLIILNK
jgi:hypothetical protein